MLLQLFLVGFILVYVLKNTNVFFGMFVLTLMLIISTTIMLRNTRQKTLKNFSIMLISTWISASLHLGLILFFVLDLTTYEPRYAIPLAGMVFSNIMNVISLAIERFESLDKAFEHARKEAMRVSLIPQINSLLAVGLVSLPGMMTGQILSGIDPLIAVRYQIVIMLLGISGGGMSVILYFLLYNFTNITPDPKK